MEKFLAYRFYDNTAQEWLLAMGVFAAILLGGFLLLFLLRKGVGHLADRTSTKVDDIILERSHKPLVIFICIAALKMALKMLAFSDAFHEQFNNFLYLFLTLNAAWLLVRVMEALAEEYLMPYSKKNGSQYVWLLPIAKRVIKVLIWSIALIEALSNAGYDIAGLLTGLGIGGIAIAIAAKNTVMNIFGGINIIVVRPFKIGDRILIDDYDGFVEDIGLSTTFIRRFIDNTLVAIPNKTFSDKEVVNISAAQGVRATFLLHLPLSLTASQLGIAVELCQQAIIEGEATHQEHIVGVKQISEMGIVLEVIFYARPEFGIWKARTETTQKILAAFQTHQIPILVKAWAVDGLQSQTYETYVKRSASFLSDQKEDEATLNQVKTFKRNPTTDDDDDFGF
ncbi:mechanosensitive ion channel family protein [Hugenholtzia roseola]|uniref:mechanosensitive ion channel family protein n=1 Tax=Hugenholtzia roseola TaxID=1002 RepID=UPI0003FF26ED|nr:mechanosensitive ion channel domain-containing protein [Hugenholtzia roseola]